MLYGNYTKRFETNCLCVSHWKYLTGKNWDTFVPICIETAMCNNLIAIAKVNLMKIKKKILFRQKWYQLRFPRVWLGTFYAPLRRPSTTSVWNKAPSWISGRIEFHPSISSNTDLEHYKRSNSCKRRGGVPCSVIVLHVFRKNGKKSSFHKKVNS